MLLTALLSLSALTATASAHGLITSPTPRTPGAATKDACGAAVVSGITGDPTSYVEALTRVAPSGKDYHPEKCNLYLCKGMQFADNTANVQTYKAGEVVEIKVNLRIPHKGVANVSVIDTAANVAIGKSLISWEGYADEKNKVQPVEQTDFKVTIPDLGGKCAKAGECVVQWYWIGAKQTYESCIDFTQPKASFLKGRRI